MTASRGMLMTAAAAAATLAAAFAQDVRDDELSELDRLSQGSELDRLAPAEPEIVREPVSVTLRALDKVVARYTDLVVPINEPVRFGTLEIVARTCDKRPPEEFPETTAFLEIGDLGLDGEGGGEADATPAPGDPAGEDGLRLDPIEPADFDPRFRSEPRDPSGSAPTPEPAGTLSPEERAALPPGPDGERVFAGWMFASSPALNPLEHPVYDVWVIDCDQKVVGVAPADDPEPAL